MTRKTKIIRLSVFAVLIIIACLLTYFVGVPLCKSLTQPDGFREWVKNKGIVGQLIFIFIVVLQVVVAIIPGEPFEIGAGYAFGLIRGTILFYIGVAIGGALVFWLSRKFGNKVLEVFFSREKIDGMKFLKNSESNKLLFFIIFALPGTPKDLLSYYAGLTKMSFADWMLISLVGRIPSVMTSIICGNQLGESRYLSAIITYAVTFVITLGGLLIYKMIIKRNNKAESSQK